MSFKAVSIFIVAAAELMGSSAFAQIETVVGAGAGANAATAAAVGGASAGAATFLAVSATLVSVVSKSTTGTR